MQAARSSDREAIEPPRQRTYYFIILEDKRSPTGPPLSHPVLSGLLEQYLGLKQSPPNRLHSPLASLVPIPPFGSSSAFLSFPRALNLLILYVLCVYDVLQL